MAFSKLSSLQEFVSAAKIVCEEKVQAEAAAAGRTPDSVPTCSDNTDSQLSKEQWLYLNGRHITNPLPSSRDAATAAVRQMYQSPSKSAANPSAR